MPILKFPPVFSETILEMVSMPSVKARRLPQTLNFHATLGPRDLLRVGAGNVCCAGEDHAGHDA